MRKPSPSLVLLVALACSGDTGDTGDTGDSGDTGDTGGDTCPLGTDEIAAGVCALSGTYTSDLRLTADNEYLLRGGVFIGDDATATVLTIDPGTTIYGEASTLGMLVIRRHSRIVAEGTAELPIVFTSAKNPGTRARGDWGGLILNGLAPLNACDTPPCEAFGEGGTGYYGGDDEDDDSGSLKYVRVEFAGALISPDNELNGIAFQGVGRGTKVDYVQVHMNDDDGIEFFGGNAEVRHVLVTGAADDSVDWTDGWQGKAQFVIAQQYEDSSDNGVEADNNADANDAAPRSSPTISNFTIVGSPDSSNSDIGLLLREGTAGALSCGVVVGMNDACLDVSGDASWGQASSGALTLRHTSFACAKPFKGGDGDGQSEEAVFTGGEGNALDTTLSPVTGSDYTGLSKGACTTPSDAFFTAADFRGGEDPTAPWTAGWTTHERN